MGACCRSHQLVKAPYGSARLRGCGANPPPVLRAALRRQPRAAAYWLLQPRPAPPSCRQHCCRGCCCSQGSLRFRAGVPLSDQPHIKDALVYGAGGLALGSRKTRYTPTAGPIEEASNNHIGWTAGGGIEVPITENLGVKLEYLHTDYGDSVFELTGGPYTVDTTDDSVRVGINWHLN